MKVLYSQLKKYLPDLKASAQEISQVYTLIGFMIDKLIEVEYENQPDYLLDLEVRQNRADLLGVEGLARELSAYYSIALIKKDYNVNLLNSVYKLPIELKAAKAVKRVMAIKLINIKVGNSPKWLKDYLALYEINSINNLVDLTNFVMLETGNASHVFDSDLVGDKLIWEINSNYKNFTTLNGDELTLGKETLVISDGKRPLSLSFIGGKKDATNIQTKNIIVEIGIYDGGLVRKNSRQLNILTEAGSRLEKFIDPESIPDSLKMLISLILSECGGEIGSQIYDNYIQLTPIFDIEVNLNKVQQIAGIEITYDESKSYLKRLGFNIKEDREDYLIVNRPINRLDIEIEEDIFEEIIRMKGFNNLDKNKLYSQVVMDVTPSHIGLMEKITDILVSNGFDEVRSWILVDEEENKKANYLKSKPIRVTNSINDDVPFLRQSISVSLLGQLKNYKRNNIPNILLFEIGKIFNRFDKYSEHNSLAILIEGNNINELKLKLEVLLRQVGINNIVYELDSFPPEAAHPKTAWKVLADEINIGIIYLTNISIYPLVSIVEVNIDSIDNLINHNVNLNVTREINQKVIYLDTNIVIDKNDDINKYVIKKIKDIENSIWKWEVVDIYTIDDKKKKYTVRFFYIDLSDKKAKELHSKTFPEIN